MSFLNSIKNFFNKIFNYAKVYLPKLLDSFVKLMKTIWQKIKIYIPKFCSLILYWAATAWEFVKNFVFKLREKSMSNKNSDSKKKNTKKKKTTPLKIVGRVILSLFAAMVIIGSVVVSVLIIKINNEVNADGEIDLSELSLNYATIVYSGTEENPVEYDRIYSAENRTWVDYNDIPLHIRYAFIDVEDERFEVHSGVDWKRTAFAALNQIFHISENRQGGSTITQQLIKNITHDDEVHWTRKAREIVRALNLEKNYTKDEILEAYLNTIALGNNTAGIKSAADFYFGKEPKELTLAETATIAALTSMPYYYDPYYYPERNATQREYVLSKMLEFGHITQAQYDAAVAEEIVLKDKAESQQKVSNITSYFTDTVIEEVINDLVETKGYSYQRAENLVNAGGLQIYTTVDTRIQNILENKYLDDLNFTVGSTADLPQSAFVVLDKTGVVRGIVGGRGQKVENRGLNRAAYTKRQPGSSLKPLSVYMPMIEANMINWSTIVEDSPITGEPPNEYPVNVYSGYYGNMTVTEAVQRSTNTIAMKLCNRFTPKASYDFLTTKLGFTSLVESDKRNGKVVSDINPASMSLGALTDGATLLEMAAGYVPIMNGGTYYEPSVYTKVYDSKGKLLLEKKPYSEQVVSAETAYITNRLLYEVIYGPNGTASNASMGGGIPVIGKTGTTENYHDRLFVGMTPNYLGAVWIGYDQPRPVDVYRISNPARLWRLVMKDVMAGVKVDAFPVSKSVVRMEYCAETGLLAGEGCSEKLVGYYKSSSLPGVCSGSCSSSSPPSDESKPETPSDNSSSTPEENNSSDNQSSSSSVVSKPDIFG